MSSIFFWVFVYQIASFVIGAAIIARGLWLESHPGYKGHDSAPAYVLNGLWVTVPILNFVWVYQVAKLRKLPML